MNEQTIMITPEGATSAPTKRFVRNKDVPLEKEIMRERIISARVMNGFTAVEAAERLGYENSTQISQIESSARKVPNDWQFFKRMSAAYSVSVDYLMGLSYSPERDAIAAESFAVMRGFEQVQQMQAAAMTTAFIKFGTERAASRVDLVGVCKAIGMLNDAMHKLRELCPEFDDLRGGATVLAAVGTLEDMAVPLRDTLRRRAANEQHMLDIAQGKQGPLASYLSDRKTDFDQEGHFACRG